MLATIPRQAGAQENKVPSYFTHGLGRSRSTEEHPRCSRTADIFIRGITTVINPVAFPVSHDAHPVPALPLPRQTGLLRTALLVPAVLTVLVPIAQLPVWDAVVGARTLHLLCPTHCRNRAALAPCPVSPGPPLKPPKQRLRTTVLLIRAIQAVSSTVATPAAGHAPAIVTLPDMGIPATWNICRDSTVTGTCCSGTTTRVGIGQVLAMPKWLCQGAGPQQGSLVHGGCLAQHRIQDMSPCLKHPPRALGHTLP